MTLEEIKVLTDEQLGDRVAGLCDWAYDKKTNEMVFVKDGDIVAFDWPSLDAMHEAEKVLVEVQKRKYGNILLGITHPDEYYGEYDLVHATVRARAAAFILTMEKK